MIDVTFARILTVLKLQQKQNASSAVVKSPEQFSPNDGFLFYKTGVVLTEIIK